MTPGAMSASPDGGNTILKAKKENGRDRRARFGMGHCRQSGRGELLLNNRGHGAEPRAVFLRMVIVKTTITIKTA